MRRSRRSRWRVFAAAIAGLAFLAGTAIGGPRRGLADSVSPVPKAPPLAPAGFLGAEVAPNSDGWGQLLKRSENPGAVVLLVLPGSPAFAAGLAPGEVISDIDGEPVLDDARLAALLRSSPSPFHRLTVMSPALQRRTVDVATTAPPLDAEEALLEQVAVDPSPVNRFVYARSVTDPAAGLSVLGDLAREFPNFAEVYAAKAERLVDVATAERDVSRRRADIVESATSALELDQRSLAVELASARAAERLHSPQDAAQYAKSAIALDDRAPRAHQLLGVALFQLRQPADALPELRRAVELDPYSEESYRDLSACYRALGEAAPSDQTDRVLAALQHPTGVRGAPVAPGQPAPVMVALGLAVSLGAMYFAVNRRRIGAQRGEPARWRPQFASSTGAFECLGAVGLASLVVPFLGGRLGLTPGGVLLTEVAAHLVPGLILLAICALAVRRSMAKLGDSSDLRRLATAAGLVGAWMTAAHLGLIVAMFRGRVGVDVALFHEAAGPAALIVAAAAIRRDVSGQDTDPAEPSIDPASS